MSTVEEIISQADSLHSNRKFTEVFELLTTANSSNPNNVEILWRLARAYFDKNEEATEKEQKKEYIQKSLDTVTQALAINADHWAVQKWMAISLSALGDHVSAKEKIANAFKIKEHADNAVKLLAPAKDATTFHLLGRWCFSIASIGFIERTAASALFGTPPTSTYNEALAYFEQAYQVDPTLIRNALFIAESYDKLKNPSKAKEFYKIASEIEPKSEFEKTLVKEAQTKAK